MIEAITDFLALIIFGFINKAGYFAVFLLMALESVNIPIPSEIILTYGGFLSEQGGLNIHLVSLFGALGCVVGGSLSYWLGARLGRPFLLKHGKWLLLSKKDIEWGEQFLNKYGEATYFLSRLLPVVRTFIAFPIGVARGNFIKFNIYSFAGSLIWSYALVYTGYKLGENWEVIKPYWDKFSYFVVFIILLVIALHIVRVVREK